MKTAWRYFGIVLLIAAASVILFRTQIRARYHALQCGRAYEHVLAPRATAEQKTHYRALTVHHADALVDLGRWKKVRFRIRHMPEAETRTAFMQKALSAFPRDTGYFQFWGAPGDGGPEAYMDVWCAREYLPEWRRFLVEQQVLIETGGQESAATPHPAPRPGLSDGAR